VVGGELISALLAARDRTHCAAGHERGEPALQRSARHADGLGDLVDGGTLGVLLEDPNDLLGPMRIGGSCHSANVAQTTGSRHIRARII
jgi:hypothetical protein